MEEQELAKLYVEVGGSNLAKHHRANWGGEVDSGCYFGDIGGEWTHVSKHTELEVGLINTAIVGGIVVASDTGLTVGAVGTYFTIVDADRAPPCGLVSKVGNGTGIFAFIIEQICHVVALLAFGIHASITINTVLTHAVSTQLLIPWGTTAHTTSRWRWFFYHQHTSITLTTVGGRWTNSTPTWTVLADSIWWGCSSRTSRLATIIVKESGWITSVTSCLILAFSTIGFTGSTTATVVPVTRRTICPTFVIMEDETSITRRTHGAWCALEALWWAINTCSSTGVCSLGTIVIALAIIKFRGSSSTIGACIGIWALVTVGGTRCTLLVVDVGGGWAGVHTLSIMQVFTRITRQTTIGITFLTSWIAIDAEIVAEVLSGRTHRFTIPLSIEDMWSRSACCTLVGTASIALSTELVATVAITIFLVFPSGTVRGGIWCAWPIILGDQIILALGAVIGWICTHFASCLTGRTLTTYICCPWRTSIHAPGFIFEVVGRTLFTGCGCLAHIASCGTSLALIW